jgi:cell division protein FtsB
METIFQYLVDNFGNKTNLVDDLVKELKTLSHAKNVALKKENVELKNKLKTANNMFQTIVDEQSRRLTAMGNTMEIFFQSLVDEFRKSLGFLKNWRKKAKLFLIQILPWAWNSTN